MTNIRFDWDKIFGIKKGPEKPLQQVVSQKQTEVFEKKISEEESLPDADIREADGEEPAVETEVGLLSEKPKPLKKKKSTSEKKHITDRDSVAVAVCDFLQASHFNMRRAFCYMENNLAQSLPKGRSAKIKKYLMLCLIAKAESGKVPKSLLSELHLKILGRKAEKEFNKSFFSAFRFAEPKEDFCVFTTEHEVHIKKIQEFIQNGLRSTRGRPRKNGLAS